MKILSFYTFCVREICQWSAQIRRSPARGTWNVRSQVDCDVVLEEVAGGQPDNAVLASSNRNTQGWQQQLVRRGFYRINRETLLAAKKKLCSQHFKV